jgi:hypothetical protein
MNLNIEKSLESIGQITYRFDLIPTNEIQKEALKDFELDKNTRLEIIDQLIEQIVAERAQNLRNSVRPNWNLEVERVKNHSSFIVNLKDPLVVA